ncbi:helix-turn-helix transcriptional regulator [Massilia eurypsychrophila]
MNEQQNYPGQHEQKTHPLECKRRTPAVRGTERDLASSLPTVGMCRWDTLSRFVPISRETWRKLVKAGKAPKPVKLSERCTMYSNAEVHRWMSDPTAYRS